MLIAAPIALVAIVGVSFLWRLAERFGMSHWLFGVVVLTVSILGVLSMTYRRFDPVRQKASALMALGLVALSIASLANEYVSRFFTPSTIYLLIALLPAMVFAVYQFVLQHREANSELEAATAEHEPKSVLRLMLVARGTYAFFLVVFLVAASLSVPKAVTASLIAAVMFSIFTDAVICYVYPMAAKRTPIKPLEAFISKMSLFADPATTRGYALSTAILSAILFAAALLLGYR